MLVWSGSPDDLPRAVLRTLQADGLAPYRELAIWRRRFWIAVANLLLLLLVFYLRSKGVL